MKTSQKLLLTALAAASITSAFAQSITTSGTGPQPYAISADKVIERANDGLCWRSAGIWTKELALSVMGSNGKPVGCTCEPEFAKEAACQPPKPAAPAPAPAPKPAPAPAPKPAPAPAPAPAAVKVNIPADALFEYDKAVVTPLGQEKLAAFAERVTKLSSLEVVIAVGHADRLGSDAYNQALSEKRAAAVKDFLVSKGVPANRVYTEGKGETQPVTNDDYKKLGPFNGKNKKLVDFFGPDRRVELEAVGVK